MRLTWFSRRRAEPETASVSDAERQQQLAVIGLIEASARSVAVVEKLLGGFAVRGVPPNLTEIAAIRRGCRDHIQQINQIACDTRRIYGLDD